MKNSVSVPFTRRRIRRPSNRMEPKPKSSHEEQRRRTKKKALHSSHKKSNTRK